MHRLAGPLDGLLRSPEMAQQTGPEDRAERVVGVEGDAPLGVELCAIMPQVRVDDAQDPVAAAVVLV